MTARPTFYWRIAGTNRNSNTFAGATITYGRTSVADNPPPAVATCQFLRSGGGGIPNIGESIIFETRTSAAVIVNRFVGSIVTVTVDADFVNVVAISNALGLMARTRVTEWVVNPGNSTPTTDSSLIELWLQCPDLDYGVTGLEPGYVTVMPNVSLGTTTVLQASQEIAAWDVDGLIYETPQGTPEYSSSRTTDTPAWALRPEVVSREWNVAFDMSTLGNVVQVNYNGNSTLTMQDAASRATYGDFFRTRTLQAVNVADATSAAGSTLLRYSDPYPIISGITVDMTSLTVAEQDSLLTSQMGTVIDTSALAPYITDMPSTCVIEGWTETIGRHTWTVSLNLSDVRQTLTPQAWYQVTPTLAWSAVPPSLTWRQALETSL